MIRYGVFYIYGIIYVAAVDLKISKHEGNDQSVNLALDTIVEFDNKNNGEDIKFLDNVQKFIGKVKTVIVKKNLRRNFNGVDSKKLTDFILSLIQMLIKFEDSNLEDFFTITGKEFKKYHYKGCKFYELIENYDLRRFLANKLDEMKHTPTDVMRRSLKTLASKIDEEKYDTNEKELIDYINSLYGQSSIELFNNILGSLDDYGLKANKNMNLSKIISAGIRSIVFDYYTELNRNARMALKTKLIEFFERTIGISTCATKSVEENKKSIITTQESTSKQKYVQQYLDLRNYAFRYSREKPLLSSVSISYNSKRISNFYNIESHNQKKENDAEIVNPSKKQKVSNSKPKNGYKYFTQPYYEKEKNRINYPISYKHSKIDKKNKRQTYRTVHPVKASILDQNNKSQSHKFKKVREPSIVTPKEHEIKNSNLDSNEFISHDHELTTSKRAEDSNMYEQMLKGKKEHLKYKYSSNITNSRLLRGKPLSDSETGSKYDVEPSMNHIFNQQPKTGKIKLKTLQKLTKVHDTDNSLSDDKVVNNIVKIPDDKLRTVDELQINQSVVKKPKSQKSKDIILSKTTEPESIEIIAFDDLQSIEKRTTVVQKSAQKLPNKVKIKSLFERNIEKPTNTQRMTFNKLTFMTLYPEFIQKWSASDAHTKKQRNDSINLKQTIRFKIRNTQTPHRKTKLTTNVSYNIRAKNIVTPTKTLNRQFEKPSWNRKAITKKNNIFRPEVSEAKLIRQLIVREKLKSFRHPLDVTSKVNKKRRNDLSSELINSEDTISTHEITEEVETKTPYETSINNARRVFFIDLNVAQSPPGKELKVFTNGRRYDPNTNKHKKTKPQKLGKNINDDTNDKLQEKMLTSIESNDSKDDAEDLLFKKNPDSNDDDSDKNDFKNKIKGENLNLTRFNRADNKFEKYMDQKFRFDINKYKPNLTGKLFIDLQNTEVKNLGLVGTSKEKDNNFVKTNLRRSNQNGMSDVKKDTRRMTNEQDIQTKTNAESDKKLNKVDFIQNYRKSFNEYTSTVRKKKIYFSYLNDGGKTDGYDLFYKQRIARGSIENSSKNPGNQYNSEYIPVSREPEKVTQFLEGRQNDKNSFNDRLNIGDKNIFNKIINQTENNIEINKLNYDILKKDERNNFENMIDKKEKDTKIFIADRMNDPGIKSDKNSHTDNFTGHIKENVDSFRTREDPIEISNRISINDGKFRLEDDANKLKERGQSVVSTKVTETILKVQRRAPTNSNVKEANINTSDFKEREEATESNIKSSITYFEPIAVTTTTEKIPISTLNVVTEQSTAHVTNTIKSHVQEINDLKKSISSDLSTKNIFRNDQNGHKTNKFNQVTDKNDLQLNEKYITDIPKIEHHIKASNTTLSYFNFTSDKVSKLI